MNSAVYLTDMKLSQKTAPEVLAEFLDGNIVVKRTKRKFNRVPADQVTEWINGTCKMHNGIHQYGQDSTYPICLRGTGDMQMQVKVQDCLMFLPQEEHTAHCIMWM